MTTNKYNTNELSTLLSFVKKLFDGNDGSVFTDRHKHEFENRVETMVKSLAFSEKLEEINNGRPNIPSWVLNYCLKYGNCSNCKSKQLYKKTLDDLLKSLETNMKINDTQSKSKKGNSSHDSHASRDNERTEVELSQIKNEQNNIEDKINKIPENNSNYKHSMKQFSDALIDLLQLINADEKKKDVVKNKIEEIQNDIEQKQKTTEKNSVKTTQNTIKKNNGKNTTQSTLAQNTTGIKNSKTTQSVVKNSTGKNNSKTTPKSTEHKK